MEAPEIGPGPRQLARRIVVDLPGIEPGTEQCECPVIPFNYKPMLRQAGANIRNTAYYISFYVFMYGQ